MGQLVITQGCCFPCSRTPITMNLHMVWAEGLQRQQLSYHCPTRYTELQKPWGFVVWSTIPFLAGRNLPLLLQPVKNSKPSKQIHRKAPGSLFKLLLQCWTSGLDTCAASNGWLSLPPPQSQYPQCWPGHHCSHSGWPLCEEQSVHSTNRFCTNQLYVILPQ